MNVRQLLVWPMFWRRGEAGREDACPRIVLLTRQPHTFSESELRTASEKGWGKKFDGLEDPMYFVTASDALTILKAGEYVVQVIQVQYPYSENLEEGARNLPREEQKKAWFQHRAWFSLDLWNGTMDRGRKLPKKEAYAALARFALHLGDSNCCAIYFPDEGWMLPNDGAAETELRRLIDRFKAIQSRISR